MDKKHYRILIAEDEKSVLSFLVDILSKKGFIVEGAANGKEALEKINRVQPDLVITDGVMPEMTGFELCRILHSNETTRNIPILFCSAGAPDELRGKGVKADAYLRKPLDIEEFHLTISRMLGLCED